MKNITWLISFFFLNLIPQFALCDGGSSDIISIKKNGQIFHFRIYSRGLLKDNDLCYYTYEGEYICEVKDAVKESLMTVYHYSDFYKTLDRINLVNIPIENKGNGIIYILKDTISFEPDSVLASLEVISAENEFKYINTYSPDLEEKDNLWLETNTFELLFSYTIPICDLSLYAIKGKLKISEKENLKMKIDNLVRKENWDLYNEELKKLHKRKIIMLGDCHC
ncbi:MAG: hypothetical protein ABJB16_06375 [Saprospiraceae bacterium]